MGKDPEKQQPKVIMNPRPWPEDIHKSPDENYELKKLKYDANAERKREEIKNSTIGGF